MAERYQGDDHYEHVLKSLVVPAVQAAGYEPIPPDAKGTVMITPGIIKNLQTADMLLCDTSGHNGNVLFELGIRTALNLPACLIKSTDTDILFDYQDLNAWSYRPRCRGFELADDVPSLTQHLKDTAATNHADNALWRYYAIREQGEAARATLADDDPALSLLRVIYDEVQTLKAQVPQSNAERRYGLFQPKNRVSSDYTPAGVMNATHEMRRVRSARL